ncbi:TPA: response regulator [Klebsiella pneumoniae]|nr:response regulator [Klebsiella pneumoniae]HBX0776288.1 response regulator [Klebsiella pneumoniae]HBX0798117.1 response regulator [Klebsiella pneumoniae]HBX0846592.1 response regulator [Klebsiella pneumoniae]HBX0916748.1 response regulator [Klebsiella pneumoniae]
MKVIIVEDEFLAQQELSWLINTHSQMEIVGSFDDGLDVLKFLQHNKVEAIFLDINIPSLDGVLLAQNISQFAHKPFIVFITAWKEHAVEAFELEAFDYILKPYQESRIINMLQKLTTAHFFRCHRSYCVNLSKIREIEPWFNNTYVLRLRDLEFQVPVSRSKVKEFRQLMNL